MADYPTSLPNFGADEVDGVDYNYAAHINKLRLEASAIATELGVRGSASGTIGARLAQALADITTLLGHFDGSGKLPHSGVQGVHVFTPFTPSGSWANWDDFNSTTAHGGAGWRVTAAGMCEWQGRITIPGATNQIIFTGAPAPADGKIRSFNVRRGASIYPVPFTNFNLAAFADYSPATAAAARPGYYIDSTGMCHMQGIVYPPSVGAGNVGIRVGFGPKPADGATHQFFLPDIGVAGGVQMYIDGTGQMIIGNFAGATGFVGVNMTASPLHAYTMEQVHYAVDTDPAAIEVQADGSAYYSGIDPLNGLTDGAHGSDYLDLSGISYFVGPGTT